MSSDFLSATAQIRDPKTYATIGAAMDVHRELGPGFLEAVYHQALAVEFGARDIPFTREMPLTIRYKGSILECTYRADFVCFDDVLVEIKALRQLSAIERAQILHYLKATRLRVGLLINFGSLSLEYERLVYT